MTCLSKKQLLRVSVMANRKSHHLWHQPPTAKPLWVLVAPLAIQLPGNGLQYVVDDGPSIWDPTIHVGETWKQLLTYGFGLA